MPKATLTLPNNTEVTIEGELSDIKNLLDYYSKKELSTSKLPEAKEKYFIKKVSQISTGKINHMEIVNLAKNVDIAESIEREILDKSSQVDRALLPLYIVEKYMENKVELQTNDISIINANLGISMSAPNISRTLNGTASKYVNADKPKKKGRVQKYTINKKGIGYFNSIIAGSTNDNKA